MHRLNGLHFRGAPNRASHASLLPAFFRYIIGGRSSLFIQTYQDHTPRAEDHEQGVPAHRVSLSVWMYAADGSASYVPVKGEPA